MKRQQENTLLSSSLSSSYHECNGHVEKTNDLQAKSVGCMSGLFHFVFKYQSRCKSLTSGKKHEKIIVAPTTAVKPPRAIAAVSGSIRDAKSTNCDKQCRAMALEMPRSPTMPPETRLRSGSLDSPRAVTPPPTLVARLMGLSCEADDEAAKEAPQTAAEKRRKLLGALEKCDKDLKRLKRIIDVVSSTEIMRSVSEEGPSLISVLDRPRISSEKQNRSAISITKAKASQQWKKPEGADQGEPAPPQPTNGGTTHHNIRLLERITDEPFSSSSRSSHGERFAVAAAGESTSLRASKAMTESVEQVFRDVTWGERREVGRIGVSLHDHICRELIEETVCEMGSSRIDPGKLPSESCRRRLDF